MVTPGVPTPTQLLQIQGERMQPLQVKFPENSDKHVGNKCERAGPAAGPSWSSFVSEHRAGNRAVRTQGWHWQDPADEELLPFALGFRADSPLTRLLRQKADESESELQVSPQSRKIKCCQNHPGRSGRDTTAGLSLALHTACLSWSPGSHLVPRALPGVTSRHRARSRP